MLARGASQFAKLAEKGIIKTDETKTKNDQNFELSLLESRFFVFLFFKN